MPDKKYAMGKTNNKIRIPRIFVLDRQFFRKDRRGFIQNKLKKFLKRVLTRNGLYGILYV